MDIIRNHKWAVIIGLAVFAPTSTLIFGALGFVGGFVNWGILTLVGLVFAVRWAYPKVRDIASDVLAEDSEDDWARSPWN